MTAVGPEACRACLETDDIRGSQKSVSESPECRGLLAERLTAYS
jgi:hypothetical protein